MWLPVAVITVVALAVMLWLGHGSGVAAPAGPVAGMCPAPAGAGQPLRPDVAVSAERGAPAYGPQLHPTGTAPQQRQDLARSTVVEDSTYPEVSNPELDVLCYGLRLDWDGHELHGVATVTLRTTTATDRLHLDLLDALAASVALDGKAIASTQSANLLTMQTGPLAADSLHTLVITYAGEPAPVPAPSPRGDQTNGLGWVVEADGSVNTFEEPYGALTWYPCNDAPSDKAFYDITVTTPPGTVGVANGTFVSSSADSPDASRPARWTTRFVLDAPTAPYLTTLAIAAYHQDVQVMSDGVPFSIWYTEADRPQLERWRQAAATAYQWLTAKLGTYPFRTAGMVVTDGQSAMETQTMLTMSRDVLRANAQGVIVHELSHQWFGDAVTTRDWSGLWLNEGWAMYVELTYYTENLGPVPRSTVEEVCRVSVGKDGQAGSPLRGHFATNQVYLCPALMLSEIKETLGSDAFWSMGAAWAAEHRLQTVTRDDFARWLTAHTGRDFTDVMAKWLDHVTPLTQPTGKTPGPAPSSTPESTAGPAAA